jgi:hypothetical protein
VLHLLLLIRLIRAVKDTRDVKQYLQRQQELQRSSEGGLMTEVWTMGEFQDPFSSGAPGIFIDTVARLGHSAAMGCSLMANDGFRRRVFPTVELSAVSWRGDGRYELL